MIYAGGMDHTGRTPPDVLREVPARLTKPASPAFHTKPVDLGTCYFPNVDDVWELLSGLETAKLLQCSS